MGRVIFQAEEHPRPRPSEEEQSMDHIVNLSPMAGLGRNGDSMGANVHSTLIVPGTKQVLYAHHLISP